MTKWGGFYSRGLRTGSRDRRGDNDGPPLLLILPNNIVLLLVAIARRRRRPPTSILEDKEKRVAVEYLGRSEAADDLGRGARVGYAGSKGARDIEGGRGRRAAVGRRGIGEINVHWRRRHNGGRLVGMGGYVRVDAYICQCVWDVSFPGDDNLEICDPNWAIL